MTAHRCEALTPGHTNQTRPWRSRLPGISPAVAARQQDVKATQRETFDEWLKRKYGGCKTDSRGGRHAPREGTSNRNSGVRFPPGIFSSRSTSRVQNMEGSLPCKDPHAGSKDFMQCTKSLQPQVGSWSRTTHSKTSCGRTGRAPCHC